MGARTPKRARLGLILSAGLLLTLGLTGCELDGDDGDTGPPGPAGEDGESAPVVSTEAPDSLEIEITDVTVSSPPVVEFTVEDGNGFPFAGLEAGEARFTMAKLMPGTDGDTDRWQSYINSVEEAGDVGPGTEDKVQAGTDSDGTLVNNGDGTYRYTFATDVTDVTSPTDVTYDPTLTHRVGLQLRGSFLGEDLPAANATHTFQPSTGSTTGINNRKIVELDSCNACHGKLAMHGGARVDVDLCVTCHNPGSADANSGNTVDFRVMIHKLHMGENLPSVESGGEYAIYGFGDSKHDYSDLGFPQDVRNCTNCHDPDDTATPQASNITEKPNRAACGACHDDVDFATGDNHPGGVVTDDSECTTCHAENRIAGSVLESHEIGTQVAAGRFEYNILDVSSTAPGETPQITFSVTDPTNGDAAYDILNDPQFTSGSARLGIDVAWDTGDYSNTGGGAAPSRPIEIDALSATDNGDGTYTVTSPTAIPASVTGSGAIGMEGHPAEDLDDDGTYDDEIPVTGAVKYFAITDDSPDPRREVVDVAKCQTCHAENDGLALHGGNRTDNVQLCVQCHNPNNTDLAMRPADPDGAVNGVNDDAEDDREERAIDFKFLIHAIHGSEVRSERLVVYGFSNSVHDFSHVRFPREASDCEACHLEGTYELPLADSVLGTTVVTQATVATSSPFGTSDFIPGDGSASDPADDFNRTPTAAVCSSCHDGDLAATHMEQNGGAVDQVTDVTQASIDMGTPTESCSVCHGPGSIAGVRVMHGLD